MKFNGTKTILWKFFVPILQASDYFRWWCHKGELLMRKALRKHEILNFFKRLLSLHKFQLMDLQSWYWTSFYRICWRFEAFDSEKRYKCWFYQVLLFNESPLWRHQVKNSISCKIGTRNFHRMVLVPLNLTLKGLSIKY